MISIRYNPSRRVLIIHNASDGRSDSLRTLDNLLGHFSVVRTVLPAAHYPPGGINGFDQVFLLGSQDSQLPPALLADVSRTRQTVVWLGGNIDQLVATKRLGQTAVSQPANKTAHLKYRDIMLPLAGSGLNRLKVQGLTKSRIWAAFTQAGQTFPFTLQDQNLWLFAADPLTEPGSSWLLADLLHEILAEYHHQLPTALIRIEDVHPLIDPASLTAIGDYLGGSGIPFLVAVIPVYAHGATSAWIPMSEKPEFVRAMHYLTNQGAMLVLHGYTHQHGQEETAVGFEFWDAEADRPRTEDSWSWAEDRLQRALSECAANDLWPLAFEPPHYAISVRDFRVCGAHFSTLVGRQQLSDRTYQIAQAFPYPIKSDQYGLRWFPENLGYVNPDIGQTVDSMLDTARQLLVVRDAMAGAFFHPFMPLDLLRQLVSGLQTLGYTFTDLRQWPHQVTWSGRLILNQGKKIIVNQR